VEEAATAVKERPDDPTTQIKLATAYMRKQRAGGDPSYFERAEATVRKALALAPNDFEARKMLAWVLGGQHRFEEARRLAKLLFAENPADSWAYGVLADAEAELGDYPAAVETVQKMVDLKPNLSSYSRAAHMRALHGDAEGALEAFDLAIEAGSARDPEARAWCYTQRGDARFSTGNLAEALAEYQRALDLQSAYPLALAGTARCQAALGKREEAMRFYEAALRALPRPDWSIALGELKGASGDKQGAAEQYAAAQAAIRAQPPGPDSDRLLALFLADHDGDAREAVKLARRAAAQRTDIVTSDTLAWALYCAGKYPQAWAASQKARRLGTQDASFLFHAGMIARRLPGRAAEGTALLRKSLALNPHWNRREAQVARTILGQVTTAARP
jgi:tetratricopeptide (TPR) repeat protein